MKPSSHETPSESADLVPATQDAWSPQQIAARVDSVGVSKARTDALSIFVLALLAGAFISIGAIFYLVVITGSELGFGATRFIGGVAFSLGLILVVVAGAELFTGNNLIAMAWVSRRIQFSELLRSWWLVYLGNVVGALGTVALVKIGLVDALADGAVGDTALAVGRAKASMGSMQAMALGVLCNALVCLSVWIAIGSRSVADKVLGVVFPIAAFVTVGFEHSIANWFFLPYAYLLGAGENGTFVFGAMRNLVVVTAGNVVGGTFLVAGLYWLAYLRPARRAGGG